MKLNKKQRIKELLAELKKLSTPPRSDLHAGFEAILRIDFHGFGEKIRIEREHLLGEGPPRTDFLVLIEDENVRMEKEIFRIFRKFNVIEYKSPRASLNERVLRKICGYACLYVGYSEHEKDIPSDQVTISIFRHKKNNRLFKQLAEKNRLIESDTKGIYYVTGYTDFPFQIVITGELEGSEYTAYRALTRGASKADVIRLMDDSKMTTDDAEQEHYRILVSTVLEKNPNYVEGFKVEDDMKYKAVMKVFKAEIDEENQRRTVDYLQSVMRNLKYTLEQAMDLLSVPQDEREALAAMMKEG